MKKEKVKKPNIIFVQLESHFDITQVKGVKFNKDPLPNFHKYMKGYSSGQPGGYEPVSEYLCTGDHAG